MTKTVFKEPLIKNDHKKMYQILRQLQSDEYIDTLNLTSKDIVSFYSDTSLEVTKLPKNDEVENKIHISPSMVGTFYYFLYTQQKLPTQLEFIKFYFTIHKKWALDKCDSKAKQMGLMGRLSRFFPSMIRDIHFYHLAKESNEFDNVTFTLELDLESKIDLLVEQNKNKFGLQFRTKTARSDYFYNKKKNRGQTKNDINRIDVPISLRTAQSFNTKKDDIKLYDAQHIKNVKEAIKNANTHTSQTKVSNSK